MTDDASPENLRKFLESDDPTLVLMGPLTAESTAAAGRITRKKGPRAREELSPE